MKGLRVKIVIFLFCKSCSFKKKSIVNILLIFGQFHPKSGPIGQKQNNFSLQGRSFYLHPYFETYQVKTLNLNQGFP